MGQKWIVYPCLGLHQPWGWSGHNGYKTIISSSETVQRCGRTKHVKIKCNLIDEIYDQLLQSLSILSVTSVLWAKL